MKCASLGGEITVKAVDFEIDNRRPAPVEALRRRGGRAGPRRRSLRRCPARWCACWSPWATKLGGQGIVVVEAMKMQNEMKSPRAGRVTAIHAKENDSVNAGAVLAVID